MITFFWTTRVNILSKSSHFSLLRKIKYGHFFSVFHGNVSENFHWILKTHQNILYGIAYKIASDAKRPKVCNLLHKIVQKSSKWLQEYGRHL